MLVAWMTGSVRATQGLGFLKLFWFTVLIQIGGSPEVGGRFGFFCLHAFQTWKSFRRTQEGFGRLGGENPAPSLSRSRGKNRMSQGVENRGSLISVPLALRVVFSPRNAQEVDVVISGGLGMKVGSGWWCSKKACQRTPFNQRRHHAGGGSLQSKAWLWSLRFAPNTTGMGQRKSLVVLYRVWISQEQAQAHEHSKAWGVSAKSSC